MLRQIRVLHANKEKLPASSSWRASELAAQAADLIQRGKIATTSADVTTLFGENFGGPCSSRASSARTMPGNLTVTIPPCEATIAPDCSPCSSTSTEKECGSCAPSGAPDADPPATPTTPGSPPLQMGVVDTARKVWLGDARTSWLEAKLKGQSQRLPLEDFGYHRDRYVPPAAALAAPESRAW